MTDTPTTKGREKLARTLILDELFDLSLYRELARVAKGDDERSVLEELIPVEAGHLAFWQKFFQSDVRILNFGRRIKLRLIVMVCRIFGAPVIHLTLEAIEVYGIRKYLSLAEQYRGQALGEVVRSMLEEEFKHEDAIVARIAERKINPERIRSIFLGFNDGSVEILGAVSGFFAAFQDTVSVLIAGVTVAVAGAISMGAGAFAAASSEEEVRRVEREKNAFLGNPRGDIRGESPAGSGVIVGVSYLFGALVPILPVLLGANGALFSITVSSMAIIGVSFVISFLSGMKITRRIFINLAIITAAVGISYVAGSTARSIWGVIV